MKFILAILCFLGITSCGANDSGSKIFVYGSLREGFHNYEKYLTGQVVKNEVGTVSGELFELKGLGYPALLQGTNTVVGEIITLNGDVKAIMQTLDELECYFGENDLTNLYDKITTSVFNTETKKQEQLPVYFYNMKRPDVDPSILVSIKEGDWKIYTEKNPNARQ